MHPTWLLYGATGYTGRLVAEEAIRRGLSPILAGRDDEKLSASALELELERRVVSLDSPVELDRALDGVAAVLHCAGPFVHTAGPMIKACLRTGTHYLDITGEIPVFEYALRRQESAKKAGCVLLPGVGFDVVPTDCLASRLAQALPRATELDLAFATRGGQWSRGTLKTMIEGLPRSGAIRREGKIVPVPPAWESRKIPFRGGELWAMTIPWGDISTAYHSTGIPNITIYSGAPPAAIRRLRRLKPILPLLGLGPVKRTMQWWVGRTVTGPDAAARKESTVHLWGEVRDSDGDVASLTATTPDGYTFTAAAAVEAVERVAAGVVGPGAWTPSRAFGAEFLEMFPGVEVDPVQRSSGGR